MMQKHVSCLLTLILVASPSLAWSDSYAPFNNFRSKDPTGKYYIVMKKNGGPSDPGRGTPVTFEIAERRPGSPPLDEASDHLKDFREAVVNPEVKVQDGDILLGKGSLERCPRQILISSTGMGFVGLDVRGYNYGSLRSGDALVVVAKDGTVRHRKDLIDLFSEAEVARFGRSAGGVWWCGGGWIDERRKQIIVVSGSGREVGEVSRLFRIVDMETGLVRDGSPEVVLTALSEVNAGALDEAIGLAEEMKLDRAKPDLVKIFSDEKTPVGSRLRAAVALASMGDRRGGDLMRKVALEKSAPSFYAVKNLPAVIGDEAAPVLCEVVRRYGDEWTLAPWQAMHSVSGRAAVPPLLDLLREGKPECVNFAMDCLGDKGPEAKAAIPDLIKILNSEPKMTRMLSTHQHAAIALGEIGPEAEAALPSLIRLAEKHEAKAWQKVKANRANHRTTILVKRSTPTIISSMRFARLVGSEFGAPSVSGTNFVATPVRRATVSQRHHQPASDNTRHPAVSRRFALQAGAVGLLGLGTDHLAATIYRSPAIPALASWQDDLGRPQSGLPRRADRWAPVTEIGHQRRSGGGDFAS